MRGVAFGAVILGSMLAGTTARAGDPGLAEALFKDGVAAMNKSDWSAACEAFAGSNDADPSPGTEINLGVCNERQGKTATAWGWYRTAAGLAEQRGLRDRAELARKEADRIEPKLRKVVVSLKDTSPGITVTRDGTTLPSATLGREVPVDPGDHVIEATGKGKVAFKTTVHLQAGPGVDRVEIPGLAAAPEEATPAGGAVAGGGKVDTGTSAPPRDGGSGQRTVGYIVGAAGIVALIVAGTLELIAIDVRGKQHDAENLIDAEQNKAVPSQTRINELQGTANRNKTQADGDQLAAIATGAGGAVLIGTGLVLVFTAGSKGSTAKDTTKPRVVPLFGQGFAGMGASFAF